MSFYPSLILIGPNIRHYKYTTLHNHCTHPIFLHRLCSIVDRMMQFHITKSHAHQSIISPHHQSTHSNDVLSTLHMATLNSLLRRALQSSFSYTNVLYILYMVFIHLTICVHQHSSSKYIYICIPRGHETRTTKYLMQFSLPTIVVGFSFDTFCFLLFSL